MTAAPNLSDFTKTEIKDVLNEIRHPFSVAVWGSENYFNAGATIRICHNFLVKEIFLIDCPAIYERASMGCEKYENIIKIDLECFMKTTKNRLIVAFERRRDLDSESLMNFKWPLNPILLFGSEKSGIPLELLKRANYLVCIPQYGIHNDFNLANAISIGVYDFMSKFTKRG